MRASEDRHPFEAGGPVTAVSRAKADGDERAAALDPTETHRILLGVINASLRGERATLTAIHRVLFGREGAQTRDIRTEHFAYRVLDEAYEGRVLIVPGWPWTASYAAPEYYEDRGTLAGRIAFRIMAGLSDLALDDQHYRIVSAPTWAKIARDTQFHVVRREEAGAILERLAAGRARSNDQKAALREAVTELATTNPPGESGLLVVHLGEARGAAIGGLAGAPAHHKPTRAKAPPKIPPPPSLAHKLGHLTLTSQTNATAPPDRARTSLGVGEVLQLTTSGATGTVTWTKTANTILSGRTGASVSAIASDRAETTTITAKDGACGCTAALTFRVVEPSGVLMERAAGTAIWHRHGIASVGIQTDIFIVPDSVSFENIEISEEDAVSVVTGFFVGTPFEGSHHTSRGAGTWVTVGAQVAGKGSQVDGYDTAQSGNCSFKSPFAAGTFDWPIPWLFRVGSGVGKAFTTVHQRFTIDAAGGMTASKGSASAAAGLNDPTTDY